MSSSLLQARLSDRKLLCSYVPLQYISCCSRSKDDIWLEWVEYGFCDFILADKGRLRSLPQVHWVQVNQPISLVDLPLSALTVGAHQQVTNLNSFSQVLAYLRRPFNRGHCSLVFLIILLECEHWNETLSVRDHLLSLFCRFFNIMRGLAVFEKEPSSQYVDWACQSPFDNLWRFVYKDIKLLGLHDSLGVIFIHYMLVLLVFILFILSKVFVVGRRRRLILDMRLDKTQLDLIEALFWKA